jgi:dienelactone hydrolase/catechol 2,3-dioxygenase-like lactoylglutathione lyase family enzyme
MFRILGAAIVLCTAVATARAQQNAFHYPPPPSGSVILSGNVQYGTAGDVKLMMDVYRPAKTKERAPALIFFNQSVGAQRTAFARWAETAASKGVVAIVPDLHLGDAAPDFRALMGHVTERAADYGIDGEAIAVYAASGNVSTALPLLQHPSQTAVKAAVIYYGTADVAELRMDLPVLLVRAGLDRPPLNASIDALAAAAAAQNAPLTMVNHPTGHHAFEVIDDNAMTRSVIDQTIDFVKSATSHPYQTALHSGLPEAIAAGHMSRGNFHAAATAYARLVAARPADARLGLAYGEALLADSQFAAACTQLEQLKGKGLGPRDLGLPAARACVQSGDGDRAVAWLQSIPQRFLPRDVQKEPVFAPLAGRAEFEALFSNSAAATSAQVGSEPPFKAVEGAFFALSVQDVDASARWYSEKFGLTIGAKSSRGNVSTAFLSGNGLEIELLAFRDSAPQVDPFDAKTKIHPRGIVKVGFRVADFDDAVASLRSRGVEIVLSPFPPRRDQRANVLVRDNSGNLIQLLGGFAP